MTFTEWTFLFCGFPRRPSQLRQERGSAGAPWMHGKGERSLLWVRASGVRVRGCVCARFGCSLCVHVPGLCEDMWPPVNAPCEK